MVASSRRPVGQTLIELLVVLTIVGVLLSLILAGIQAARESTRNTACRANLAQLAKALQLSETQAQRGFPRRFDTLAGKDQSWIVHSLPYLDQRATFDQFKAGANGERYLEGLICPSDPPSSKDEIGWLSYVSNCGGVVDQTTLARLMANGIFNQPDGPRVSLDYLNNHDGSSYTALVSENIQAGRWTEISRAMVGFVWHQGDPIRDLAAEQAGENAGDANGSSGAEGCTLMAPQAIDNGSQGYSTTGTWTATSTAGYLGNFDRTSADSASTARWTFSGLSPGEYQVSITWKSYASCAANVPYTFDTGGTTLEIAVNQQNSPAADEIEDGTAFQHFGEPISVYGDTLAITLDASATKGYAIADAIRIECVGHLATSDNATSTEARKINRDKEFSGVSDLDHARPSSYHHGGVNLAFADGRVRFIKESIAYHVYRQLMTPYGDGSDARNAAGDPDPVLDAAALGE